MNTAATRGNAQLRPLVSSTDAEIRSFPTTPKAIASLSESRVDIILRALEIVADDNLAGKRRQLMMYSGAVNYNADMA